MTMFEEHIGQLDVYFELAKTKPDYALESAYQFIKEIAPLYYHNSFMDNHYYCRLLDKLKEIEKCALMPINMVSFSRVFDVANSPDKDDVFDYIIWQGRWHLITRGGYLSIYKPLNLSDLFFAKDCYNGSRKIKEECDGLGITCELVMIYPAFGSPEELELKWYEFFHCFNIIKYNSKEYLVDVAVSQFFNKQDNHPGRLGVVGYIGPSVGYYMLRLNRGKELARKLLTDGYVELTEELFKTYMDAIMLSFRNGLFYEEQEIFLPNEGIISPENSIILPYTAGQYRDFLNYTDSQVKHEKRYYLGRQDRPLRYPDRPIFR